jgi:hypothetical protein
MSLSLAHHLLTDPKILAKNKHNSFFVVFSDEEKKSFITLPTALSRSSAFFSGFSVSNIIYHCIRTIFKMMENINNFN